MMRAIWDKIDERIIRNRKQICITTIINSQNSDLIIFITTEIKISICSYFDFNDRLMIELLFFNSVYETIVNIAFGFVNFY